MEIDNVKRVEIDDYTIQLILLLHVESPLTVSFRRETHLLSVQLHPLNSSNTFGLYECEAENPLKVSKSFIIIDGKIVERRRQSKLLALRMLVSM